MAAAGPGAALSQRRAVAAAGPGDGIAASSAAPTLSVPTLPPALQELSLRFKWFVREEAEALEVPTTLTRLTKLDLHQVGPLGLLVGCHAAACAAARSVVRVGTGGSAVAANVVPGQAGVCA